MGVQNIRIIFDNSPQGIYFPGQTIYGRVNVQVLGNEAVHIRGISVKFHGGSQVKWTKKVQAQRQTSSSSIRDRHNQSSHNHSETVVHSNREEYFSSKFFVYGNGQETPIFPGDHFFPFSYILPANLPSSFESSLGHIRYLLEARVSKVSRALFWVPDKVAKVFFTINGILDLNLEPGANAPVQMMDHKTLCCWCCQSGPISALVMLPKSGFVPGEVILMKADVDNMSNRAMNRTQVRIIQKVRYQATDAMKMAENRILHANQGEIPPGESQTWNNYPLHLPALPPSGPRGCSIIQISYHLEFHVEPSSIGMDLVLRVPIIIGSIPTQNSFNQFQGNLNGFPPPVPSLPSYSNQEFVPPFEGGVDQLQPSAPSLPMMQQYPDLPPPSYMEAVNESKSPRIAKSDDDNDETSANWEFVPQYAVYQPRS